MTLMQVGLDDKYRLDAKRIYLSGIQALVRLPMLQRERDRLQNLNTPRFIPGYPGRPSRHVRQRSVARKIVSAIARYRLRSGSERGPRGNRGVGQPAGRNVSR